ncbi:MAG TPA: DUF2461 domain-containing protein [Vicinamibacterales bacterium]|nr:DUF2461 domain-containing protein [Vicinamibacterales bacterium]
MHPSFTTKTLSFLRALKRNNDREWFRARKDEYELHVRAPMVAVIERLAVDFGRFAPELDASPNRCIYRIYRDTRFSEDKTPLKTHVAASFRWRGLPKHRGAGLYFEVTPGWVWMGGGFYAPETADLARIRQHISDTHPELDRLTRAPAFRRTFQVLEGEQLTRIPRGFAKDDPAAAWLKYRNFLAGREFPAALATSAAFYATLLGTFKAVMPIVRFLNEPLVGD